MTYNEQNRNGRWYPRETIGRSEADEWYASEPAASAPPDAAERPGDAQCGAPTPYFRPAGAPPPYAVPPKPPRRRVAPVWRVLAIVALCLLGATGFVLRLLLLSWNVTASESVVYYGSASEAADASDVEEYFETYFTSTSDIDIPSSPTGTGVTLPVEAAGTRELTLQEIYTRLCPTVVGITCYQNGTKWSWGTGVIFTSDGYIVTNAHILEGSDSADVSLSDGSVYTARFLGSDTATDLAVLKIEAQGLDYAVFADSETCQVGDEVVAIGNPLGEQYAGTMTNGIISAVDRSVSNKGFSMTLMQTNAALNEGNSGGPLINMYGQVVGITNMKVMFTYSATVEGIGFAIPTSVIEPVVNAIIETGYVPGQPTLGIVAGTVSEEAMALYDLPAGLYISSVDKNSDAYAQGLRAGDVITKVNGTAVTTVNEVNAIKDGMSVGDELCCTVYRDGKTFDITFALVDKGVLG